MKVMVTGHDGYIGRVLVPIVPTGGPRGCRLGQFPVRGLQARP